LLHASSVLSISFFYLSLHHPDLHSFPTRRSSDLKKFDNYHHVCHQEKYRRVVRECMRMNLLLKQVMYLILFAHQLSLFLRLPLRSEEHTSELQSRFDLVCRLLLEKKNKTD